MCLRVKASCVFVRVSHLAITCGIVATLLAKDSELSRCLNIADPPLWYGVVYLASVILALFFYYLACFVDPGYVPIPNKVSFVDSDEEDGDESRLLQDQPESDTENPPNKVKLRKCGFCGIQQPMRARHCEDCCRCVQKFDHHCPWLDACVGEKNHKYFWLFVTAESAIIIWTTVIVWRSFESHVSWVDWLSDNALYLLDMVVLVIGGFVVLSLFFFHSYLMAANTTTWEFASRHRITYLKYLGGDYNPFHEGICRNIYNFLCTFRGRRWDVLYRRNSSPIKTKP